MLANVTCHPLTSDSLRERAAKIVDKKYREEGYVRDGEESPQKIASYVVEGASELFGVLLNDELYGTLALIFDGEKGLPMDSLYKDEVDIFRAQNYKCGEVVQFAIDTDLVKKHLSPIEGAVASVPLFGYLLSYAKKHEFDYLCISVNPKHVPFYSLIGFEKIGEQKYYASVDAPAVAMAFNVEAMKGDSFGKNMITKMIMKFFSAYQVDGV